MAKTEARLPVGETDVKGQFPFDDLRSFIEAAKEIDEYREINGADWNREIGALTEAAAELITDPPMLIFDNIKGYPPGFRLVSLSIASVKRAALAWGLPIDKHKMELIRMGTKLVGKARSNLIPPKTVKTGPVMENVLTGDKIDMWKFPSPLFHLQDGGRYIGTGDIITTRDPDSGYLNTGTYRMQVHEKDLLGLWISPGKHGRLILQRYWEQGKSAPITASFGHDPLTFLASTAFLPWGKSELDLLGAVRGKPVEVIEGPITGLPIPAHSEIAIEGEVPPPSEQARDEGPFGEWPGYYSGGTIGTGEQQPVVRIKAVYHRNNPIILDSTPLWPGACKYAIPFMSGVFWDQLESAGVQDIVGVWQHTSYWLVISIRQRYAGHAKQAGHAALGCRGGAYNGRYIIIVDEDIDPSDMKEVEWAMMTRVDPATDIELINGTWSTPLDPRMTPEQRETGDHTNSRAIIYAVRPWTWRDKFPKASRTEKDLRAEIVAKYKSILPFPNL